MLMQVHARVPVKHGDMKTSSYLVYFTAVSSDASSFILTEARVLLCLLDAPQATWSPPQGQNQSYPGFSHLPFIPELFPSENSISGILFASVRQHQRRLPDWPQFEKD